MKQTTLELNGPILGVVTQPVGLTTTPSSTATFVGIATATFPTQIPANSATGTGDISYRWYAEGVGALSDGSFSGATISGTATTTLTVSNVKSPETNNLRFFLTADYSPSAYQSSSPITVGTARSTGNAINDTLIFNTVSLTVLPTIAITSQPGIATVGAGGRVSFAVGATLSDNGFGDLSYQWNIDGQNLTDNGDTIIGATQPTLFFVPTSVGVSTVKVTVSNPSAVSVASTVVDLFVLTPRNIIIFEGFDSQNNYKKIEVNLGLVNDFTLTDDTFGLTYNTITFYAPENNIDADLQIRTSKGSDAGSYSGGEGGFSRIRITLEKNIEHTVLGISNNSGLFIYRKSSLIAVVGKGGNAGSSGNGGAGGGINIAGESGSGRNSGIGGARLSTGQLTTNGIFGSNSAITTFQSGDSKASIPNGGRTISCSKGNYWISRGKSPCEDVGLTQFYNTNGTLISQSSLINRGFKAGYTITATEGASISNGGDGGNGATGGSGGNQGGGGGGSGYTDGSYTLTSTSSGGNTSSKSTINFRIYVAPAPVYVAPPYDPGPAPEPTPLPPPTPTRQSAESVYGAGFLGQDVYASGLVGSKQPFIETLKPEAASLGVNPNTGLNAFGQTNYQTAFFLITVYEQLLNRAPEGGGFDYWFSNAVTGSYGSNPSELVRVITAAAPREIGIIQENGGRTGIFDSLGNPTLGGNTSG